MKTARVSSPGQQKKQGQTADPVPGTSSDLSDLECPICHEEFTDPKLLPCAHTVCRHCIQSWLDRKGDLAECPLCRLPLGDPTYPVEGLLGDQWLTDLFTKDLVTFQKTLEEPHICHMCPAAPASSYCFHCEVKLCASCSKYHRKLPGTANHDLEEMTNLTVEQLMDNHRTACPRHTGNVADMYCSSHDELICMICYQTRHWDCPRPQTIPDAAYEKRGKVQHEARWLENRAVDIALEIEAARTHFQDMRKKATDYFDNLEVAVRNRRDKINKLIQAEEETVMTSAAELERLRSLMSSHVRVAERAVDSSADDTLLQMQGAMLTRLMDLDAQGLRQHLRPLQELRFDHPASLVLPCLGKLVLPEEKSLPSTSKRRAEPEKFTRLWKRSRTPDWGGDFDYYEDSSSLDSQC